MLAGLALAAPVQVQAPGRPAAARPASVLATRGRIVDAVRALAPAREVEVRGEARGVMSADADVLMGRP